MSEKIHLLKQLVERFDSQIETYKKADYNESTVRNEFIDKLFQLFGWDVQNEKGYSERFKDVVKEDRIVIKGQTKNPDYAFRIGGNVVFYVEAKKPSINIKEDKNPAYQLRRYAYTKKLPISILTDFEEFAIYECNTKPNQNDKASTSRIAYFTFDQYEEKFEELCRLFSPEAIKQGSFDKYIKSSKGKTGTETIDKALLKDIETWRDSLAQNIALRNPNLAVYQLSEAVQKIIDRIIFLRIAEDKGIEREQLLQTLLTKKGNALYPQLCQIFETANKKYNSGLFKTQTWLQQLTIDDKKLIEIIDNLYFPKCPYEFSVLPIEILGNIYEKFLGKVIRLTDGHRAKVEEKPEVRKAGGVFYTPQYIVDYIVRNTIGKKIHGKTPDEVAKMSFCDPACGSGSFLIGVYQYLLNWHSDYYSEEEHRTKAEKAGKIYFDIRSKQYLLSLQEKQQILLNNIYGVDIDAQAVEVTKLSLYLKLLDNEGERLQNSQSEMFRDSDFRLLPNLDNNIKCGNSLIGSDFYNDKNLSLFSFDDQRKMNVFDWEKEFPKVFENGGFDGVVGNPPYVNVENLDSLFKNALFQQYSTCSGRTDIYVGFIEKSLSLIKNNCSFSFIIPYAFTNQTYGERLRQLLVNDYFIEEIIDLSNYYVFYGVGVKNIIIKISKNENRGNTKIKIVDSAIDFQANMFNEQEVDQRNFLSLSSCRFETNPIFDLLPLKQKIEDKSIPFENICLVAYGARLNHKTDSKKPKSYYVSAEFKEDYKKFFEGKNINRYKHTQYGWLNYKPSEHYNPMFPELFENEKIVFINVVSDRLRFSLDTEEMYNSHTVVNCVKIDDLKKSNHPTAKKSCKNADFELIAKYDLLFLLGILNSKLINWYFLKFQSEGLHFYPNDAKNLPIIANFAPSAHDSLVSLVNQMLEVHKLLPLTQTETEQKLYAQRIEIIDKQIDAMVYALYGLTAEEIAVVEKGH